MRHTVVAWSNRLGTTVVTLYSIPHPLPSPVGHQGYCGLVQDEWRATAAILQVPPASHCALCPSRRLLVCV